MIQKEKQGGGGGEEIHFLFYVIFMYLIFSNHHSLRLCLNFKDCVNLRGLSAPQPSRYRWFVLRKPWYPPTRLQHIAMTRKTAIWIFISVKTLHLTVNMFYISVFLRVSYKNWYFLNGWHTQNSAFLPLIIKALLFSRPERDNQSMFSQSRGWVFHYVSCEGVWSSLYHIRQAITFSVIR
jgi:hypothetical protein